MTTVYLGDDVFGISTTSPVTQTPGIKLGDPQRPHNPVSPHFCKCVLFLTYFLVYAFSGTFADSCSVWIGQDGLSLKMSHTSPDGLVVEITDEGLMYQVIADGIFTIHPAYK
jgi:hypothetical protein